MNEAGPYDFIIVGAGTAGCVLANRLSANPNHRVLLIEAGPSDGHPFIKMPKGMAKLHVNPRYVHGFTTEPEAGNGNRSENWIRGKVLGGSSAVNGMMYVRGQPADYDAIARETSEDWDWKHMGAAFKAVESHELGEAETRGGNGPLHISMPEVRSPLNEALIGAGKEMGLPVKADTNAPDNGEGVGYAPLTIYRGRRQSSAAAFLTPVRGRPNLTIKTGVVVDRVTFDNGKATGVIVREGAHAAQISARKEVIVCVGALHSPAMLMRSGIGDPGHLRELGVDVVSPNPSVGKNMREHRVLMMQYRVRGAGSENAEYSGWRLVKNVAQYYLQRKGPMAGGAYEAGAWIKTRPDLERPDAQMLFAPFSYDFAHTGGGAVRLEKEAGMNITCFILRPQSQGEITLRSKDPRDPPVIKPNWRVNPADGQTLIALAQYVRRYLEQPSIRHYVEKETMPGAQFDTDEKILSAYDQMGGAGYHAVGTCRMGKDEQSVVTPTLKVRGVDNLRVVDASVFPVIPAGNTNGPVTALAWRAADIILRDY